jgi:non-canonical poly(A) RNA polymerase PAPD5/7
MLSVTSGVADDLFRLNAEIDAYYRYVSPTREEYEVRLLMIELITRAVHRTWPDAEVTPFGSWQTQLYLPSG